MAELVEIYGEGRGMSVSKNMKKIIVNGGGDAYQICGEPAECRLAFATGMVQGEPDTIVPVLIYPDNVGEPALTFEEQDGHGNWHYVDLKYLVEKIAKRLKDGRI